MSAFCTNESLALTTSEDELRAAVIIGILRFANQYDHTGNQYSVCLAGNPPSSEKLVQSSGMPIMENRFLTVAKWHADLPLTQCAAVVIGPSITAQQQKAIAIQARTTSSILLCDNCGNGALAHATLQRKDSRITFAVDVALARTAQVSFSSQLLKLADNVQKNAQQ